MPNQQMKGDQPSNAMHELPKGAANANDVGGKSIRKKSLIGVALSVGGYTSFFPRKLLPPLGFYRPAQKYATLRARCAGMNKKLEILREMWQDFQKFQVGQRFTWPPRLFYNKFFWTTGYYPDYHMLHKAQKYGNLDEESSDEEFIDLAGGNYSIAVGDDINVHEFEKYKLNKKGKQSKSKQGLGDNTKGKTLGGRLGSNSGSETGSQAKGKIGKINK